MCSIDLNDFAKIGNIDYLSAIQKNNVGTDSINQIKTLISEYNSILEKNAEIITWNAKKSILARQQAVSAENNAQAERVRQASMPQSLWDALRKSPGQGSGDG